MYWYIFLLLLYMIYFNIVVVKSVSFLWHFVELFCNILTFYYFYFNCIGNIANSSKMALIVD
jgi:hypothetical protein